MSGDFLDQVRKQQLISHVNNEIHLYHATGDARFFWRAYRRLHKAGEPIPQDFLNKIAEFASSILSNDDLSALPKALELAGSDKSHIGPKQSALYRRRWKIASEVEMVKDLYKISTTQAIKAVAENRELSFGNVKKIHWQVFKEPLVKRKKVDIEDAGALLQKLWG